jgi:hypothetical protein
MTDLSTAPSGCSKVQRLTADIVVAKGQDIPMSDGVRQPFFHSRPDGNSRWPKVGGAAVALVSVLSGLSVAGGTGT